MNPRTTNHYARHCRACIAKVEVAYRARRKAGTVGVLIRRFVIERDGARCQVCSVQTRAAHDCHGRDDATEVDHIVPVRRGGPSDASNLRVLCRKCNRAKGTR